MHPITRTFWATFPANSPVFLLLFALLNPLNPSNAEVSQPVLFRPIRLTLGSTVALAIMFKDQLGVSQFALYPACFQADNPLF